MDGCSLKISPIHCPSHTRWNLVYAVVICPEFMDLWATLLFLPQKSECPSGQYCCLARSSSKGPRDRGTVQCMRGVTATGFLSWWQEWNQSSWGQHSWTVMVAGGGSTWHLADLAEELHSLARGASGLRAAVARAWWRGGQWAGNLRWFCICERELTLLLCPGQRWV